MEFIELDSGQVLIKEVFETYTEEKHYDMKYHTKLRYENSKVKAEVFDYLDNFIEDFNNDVIFEYEGNQITVQAINGIAEIDFIADEGLECTVKTVNEKFRNGEATFNV
ncbi:hypothetical protein [Schinkia azotoformans]|uniref:hypothetical protein n=1 Tax=Schinkia azotoformans TaxID=1454 RepID=UPI002DBCB562|nr:hypothetical protein [Schinkia azotoformans]MEC1716590.1 hypothetical protein [Schinkia azotoformans]MEC1739428.1 hypothetical protein [Schinkia azotoformans]MEC1745502.1 hypothetical protein [Schinkia azotoformans]MEC1756565.1 hypothetical protein [Schinkia azotoformans]MEC1765832.1 hypothetical protein [Schinkia azotoformans]